MAGSRLHAPLPQPLDPGVQVKLGFPRAVISAWTAAETGSSA